MKMEWADEPLLSGSDPVAGLVAVVHEPGATQDLVRCYWRAGQTVTASAEDFKPVLWVAAVADLGAAAEGAELEKLAGEGPLKYLARFGTWKALEAAVKQLKAATGRNPSAPDAPYLLLNDPVEQYLLTSGRTLLRGMEGDDLRRMQVDIETWTAPGFEFCNAGRASDRIVAIALADNQGWSEVLDGAALSEADLLAAFVERVRERDPDVLEGHNLFRFDLPYLQARAKRWRVRLALGRDGSPPRVRASRFTAGERTLNYPRAEIMGRHIVDTYFLAQIYDVSQRALEGHGLKAVARHFGLAAENRTYIPGDEIAATFSADPQRVMRYAADDVIETRALAELLTPTYRYQAQLLPMTYQSVCVRGNAAKVEALMLRAYFQARQSLPQPGPAGAFAGGATAVFQTGVLTHVEHADVRSLYPSLMLQERLGPASDPLGVFLHLLDRLRTFRLEAKAARKTAATPAARQRSEALATAFKVLINSFYGYLGFAPARFNDFAAAARVAEAGRDLLHEMLDWLRAHDATPIEMDTDGIYFTAPPGLDGADLEAFRGAFAASLPPGIEIEFDPPYRAMYSYKMKNYALLTGTGELIIKGGALKSRGLEPFQRDFMRELIRLRLEGREADIPAWYEQTRADLAAGRLPIRSLAKTETLSDDPQTYAAKRAAGGRARNAAYELALAADRAYRAGDQLSYYVAGTKPRVVVHRDAKLLAAWDPEQPDENRAYYLAKLETLYQKLTAAPDESADAEEQDADE
ncbi:MAG: DNA polymerase II [Candidatus Marinimicrobia bacterium]|nr:DNA polymerase II [Candidatus Neomarinimicrobiota bacterium]